MRTATPPATYRRDTDSIAATLDRARQANLAVATDKEDTATVSCPRCIGSLVLARQHWYPIGAARIVDLFICAHRDRQR
jgi:hypothetical protein